jgi:hypothetical protein
MTKKLDSSDVGVSVGDQRRKRAYLREFAPAMVLYVVAVFVSVTIGRDTAAKKTLLVNSQLAGWAPFMIGMTAWGVLSVRHVSS